MATGARPALDVELMPLLGQASYALMTELAVGLARLGITPRGHHVLLHALHGDLTQTELAGLCALDKTTMVVTLDELEKAGLAQRQLSGSDRRTRIVAVTETGRQVLAEAQEIVGQIYADVLSALPEGEREAFVQGLERLVGGRLAKPAKCERPVRRRRMRQVVP